MSDMRNRVAFYNLAAALSEDVLRTPAYELLAEAAEDRLDQRRVTDPTKVLARASRRAALNLWKGRLRKWMDALRDFFRISQLAAHPRRMAIIAVPLLLLIPVLIIEYTDEHRQNGPLSPQVATSSQNTADHHRVSVLPFSGPSSLTPLL